MPRNPTPPPKKERQKKTPEERATEALTTAGNVHARLSKKFAALAKELTDVRAERDAVKARMDYLALSPDLSEETKAAYQAEHNPPPDVATDA